MDREPLPDLYDTLKSQIAKLEGLGFPKGGLSTVSKKKKSGPDNRSTFGSQSCNTRSTAETPDTMGSGQGEQSKEGDDDEDSHPKKKMKYNAGGRPRSGRGPPRGGGGSKGGAGASGKSFPKGGAGGSGAGGKRGAGGAGAGSKQVAKGARTRSMTRSVSKWIIEVSKMANAEDILAFADYSDVVSSVHLFDSCMVAVFQPSLDGQPRQYSPGKEEISELRCQNCSDTTRTTILRHAAGPS